MASGLFAAMAQMVKSKSEGEQVPQAPAGSRRWMVVAGLAVAFTLLAGLAVQVLTSFSRPPDYDEHFHVQFLWLVSEGRIPDRDFLCPHPGAPFLLFGWVLDLFPQKPMLLIVLRLLMLVPYAALVVLFGLLARRFGRGGWLAGAALVCMVASGRMPSVMEIRFDVIGWVFFLASVLLMVRGGGGRVTAAAAGLAVLSLFISPKHIFPLALAVVGFGVDCWLQGRRAFVRHVLAALGGLAAVLLLLTLRHPTAVVDSVKISYMNFAGQGEAVYPETLLESLLILLKREPWLALVFCVAPGLFFVRFGELERRQRLVFVGLFAGALYLVATLPCGWTQYTTLGWMVFLPFVPWVLPKAGRARQNAVCALLLAAAAGFFLVRTVRAWNADRLMEEIAVQEEFQRLCPPGETYVGMPAFHVWFRHTPGYVFIDDNPSFRYHFGPERQHLFLAPYFKEQLEKKPPAVLLVVGLAEALPEQNTAAEEFFARRPEYELYEIPMKHAPGLPEGHVRFACRRSLATNAVVAKRLGR